jgi:hypothetical protein
MINRLRVTYLLTLALLFSTHAFCAEGPSIRSAGARFVSGHWQVEIGLTDSLTEAPANCNLVDVTHSRFVAVVGCSITSLGSGVLMRLNDKEDLNADTAYIAVLQSMIFTPKDSGVVRPVKVLEKDVLVAQPSVPPAIGPSPTPAPTPVTHTPCFLGRFGDLFNVASFGAADGRDDANLFFSGQVTHSRGKDFVGTYDTKLDFSGRCNLNGTVHLIGPMLDLKGGNDPNGSPDSLNFGFLWEFPILRRNSLLSSIRLTQNPRLESTQDFTQRNFIYGIDFRGVFKPWVSGNSMIRSHFRPVVGAEVGKNLHGIIPAVDSKNIARVKIGTAFFLIFAVAIPALQDITFETSYARRWPLIDEVTFAKGKSGGFTPIFIGTTPRDYVKETMALNFTKVFGTSVAYEYGSVPPLYQFLDSKFTFGLNVKLKFDSK